MKEFKGLKVPNAPKMETAPILDESCHVGGGEYCRNIGCHLKSNEMEFNKEENVLRVDGKVYDVVERKESLPKFNIGDWVFNEMHSPSKVKRIESIHKGFLFYDKTLSQSGLRDSDEGIDKGFLNNKYNREATEEDFLSFGYRLLKTKQPWDGEVQEFLVKELDLVIARTDYYHIGFDIRLYCFQKHSSYHQTHGMDTCGYDYYLPATSENIAKMTEWMKGNLK